MFHECMLVVHFIFDWLDNFTFKTLKHLLFFVFKTTKTNCVHPKLNVHYCVVFCCVVCYDEKITVKQKNKTSRHQRNDDDKHENSLKGIIIIRISSYIFSLEATATSPTLINSSHHYCHCFFLFRKSLKAPTNHPPDDKSLK